MLALRRNRVISFIMFILIVAIVFSSVLVRVQAVNVAITNITPVLKTGKVGDSVNIIGTINTTNGAYRIMFEKQVVVSQNASGSAVNASFTVPQIAQGNHTLILQDVTKNVNATSSFIVSPAYYLKVDKGALVENRLFQEESSVTFWANITGGTANKAYSANITVSFPSPLSNKSWSIIKINTTDSGYGAGKITYPNASTFSETPTTNYTGTYSVTFNQTLASDSFFIALTNASQYHRNQVAGIKAAGYKPGESVSIKIGLAGNLSQYTFGATSGSSGTVSANWAVPSTAKIGTYLLNLTSNSSSPTVKLKPDVQNFTIPGYSVNVTTLNLAGETVPYVTIAIKEGSVSVESVTGGADGIVPLKLETGSYTSVVASKTHPVATLNITVTGPMVLSVTCNLTDLQVFTVAFKDGVKVPIPNVTMFITPENAKLISDINGTVKLRSLWPAYNYTINALRYDIQYNITTIPTLRVNGSLVPLFNFTIDCHNLKLNVNVVDSNSQPLGGVTVVAQEQMGGLFYQSATNAQGLVSFDCAFGKYTVNVYDTNGLQLNQTSVQLLNLSQPVTNLTIQGALYSLSISLKVVDYFGQPISNTRVTLQREGLALEEKFTQSDGVATFDGITGGNMEAAVYLDGQTLPYETMDFMATQSKTVELRLRQYVLFGGTFVDVGILATALVIIITVLAVLVFEVHHRRRTKSKVESQTENQ